MPKAKAEELSPAERREQYAAEVASALIDALEKGVAPFQKPWEESLAGLPVNAVTGKPYQGSNMLYLSVLAAMKGYDDNRWITFQQAKSLGENVCVRKGEHGSPIVFPATHYEVIKKDEGGKPILGPDGQPQKVYVKYDQPRYKHYTVFHASQIENMPERGEIARVPEWQRHERAETIIAKSEAVIRHGGNRAYYMPSEDRIQVPSRTQFADADRYYATVLHELGHWTGAESRLNRAGITGDHPFGSEAYAKEELRAEIASLMVGQELGVGHDPEPHASYVATWVSILRDKPSEILWACGDASKIQQYVLAFEHPHDRERDQEREPIRTADSLASVRAAVAGCARRGERIDVRATDPVKRQAIMREALRQGVQVETHHDARIEAEVREAGKAVEQERVVARAAERDADELEYDLEFSR